jgi:hypothetical protein
MIFVCTLYLLDVINCLWLIAEFSNSYNIVFLKLNCIPFNKN